MNLLHLDRKTIFTASLFAAPVLAVQLAQPLNTFMGTPQSASATSAMQLAPIDAPAELFKASELQLAVAEKINSLRSGDDSVASPFYYPPRPDDAPATTGDPVVAVRTMPQFRISSILTARDGRTLAMINGKMCAVGTHPAKDWTIISIDADAKTVTVSSDEDGETLVLQFGRRTNDRE